MVQKMALALNQCKIAVLAVALAGAVKKQAWLGSNFTQIVCTKIISHQKLVRRWPEPEPFKKARYFCSDKLSRP